MEVVHALLAVACGGLVGFTLGLIGGGGSIMATPLLLYVVGLPPHVAIGTGALSVPANALFNFAGHARCGHVRWKSALIFAVVGAVGAVFGSTLGKHFDGQRLLFLFAILMVVVGVLMLRSKPKDMSGNACDGAEMKQHVPQVSAAALLVGTMSGFFGIGGGFLIVPGLLVSTRMPMLFAVGSSLLAVSSFGVATAANYAWSGLVDWPVAGLYMLGGRRRPDRHAALLGPGAPSGGVLPDLLRRHFRGCRLHDFPDVRLVLIGSVATLQAPTCDPGPARRLASGSGLPRP